MKIQTLRNRAMTLLSAMILLSLFILFIAGLCVLCCRIRDAMNRIAGNRDKKDKDASELVAQLNTEDQQTLQMVLESAEPMVTLSNLVQGQTFQVTVEFSTNLTEWEPWTNFTASFTNWDLSLPQQTNRGPMGFYRITTSGQ